MMLGMGDVLNPTAGTALDCGLFAGGVFKKECWCLDFPSLCSSADYQAAYALAHPEVYAAVQSPPTVGSPSGSLPPASGVDAQAIIDAIIAQQKATQDAQASATMAQTAANLKQAAQTQCPTATLIDNGDGTFSCPPGTNWWLIGGLAAGVLVLMRVTK